MIRRLRHLHRVLWTGLFATLPVLFAVVILARGPRPLVVRMPAEISGTTSSAEEPLSRWTALWGGLPLTMMLYDSPPRLGLDSTAPLGSPDLLLYWSTTPTVGSTLPEDALLLGELRGIGLQRFELPSSDVGELVLYTLGHREILARVTWPPSDPEPSP